MCLLFIKQGSLSSKSGHGQLVSAADANHQTHSGHLPWPKQRVHKQTVKCMVCCLAVDGASTDGLVRFPVEVWHGGNGLGGRCGRTRDDWRPVRVQRRRRPMSRGRRRRNWGAAAGLSAEVTCPVSRWEGRVAYVSANGEGRPARLLWRQRMAWGHIGGDGWRPPREDGRRG